MKKYTPLFFLFLLSSACSLQATCVWMSRVTYFNTWDTCRGVGYRNSVNAEIELKSPGCLKYEWTVNGKVVGRSNKVNYLLTRNGIFKFCLKVTDTCNQCDTVVCITKTMTCFPVCNWKSKYPFIKVKDSCNGKVGPVALYATVSMINASCVKFQWLINGSVKGVGPKLTYPLYGLQNYQVCLKMTDSCNMCDTTICMNRKVDCKPSCRDWKSNQSFYWHNDTCIQDRTLVRAGVYTNNYPCLRYEWLLDGVKIATGLQLNHYLSGNGIYNFCLRLRDTCNDCDTSYCFTQYVHCNTNMCDWASKNAVFEVHDTCKGNGYKNSLSGNFSFPGGPDSCYKYTWLVNGVVVSREKEMNQVITKNGICNVCLNIADTCNKCDTTFCAVRNISCFTGCNWKARSLTVTSWDTCNGRKNSSVNASVSVDNNSCVTYSWVVNGVKQKTGAATFTYPVTQDGKYAICVTITDTCKRCDTTICITRSVTCLGAGCDFEARIPYFSVWDTCRDVRPGLMGYLNFDDASCLSFRWKIGNAIVSNTNTLHYELKSNGTYKVCVSVTDTCGHCDTSFCMTAIMDCRLLGIHDKGVLHLLNIYPNPAARELNVVWSGEAAVYEVLDMPGHMLVHGRLVNGLNSIDISGFEDGIYMFRLYDHDSNTVRIVKVLVQAGD